MIPLGKLIVKLLVKEARNVKGHKPKVRLTRKVMIKKGISFFNTQEMHLILTYLKLNWNLLISSHQSKRFDKFNLLAFYFHFGNNFQLIRMHFYVTFRGFHSSCFQRNKLDADIHPIGNLVIFLVFFIVSLYIN